MAGPDYNQMWNDPDYQFVARKISKMRPDQMAILSDLVAGSAWANKGAAQTLADMKARMQEDARASNLASTNRGLNLAEKSFEEKLSLANRATKFERGQQNIGTALGIGGVLGQAYLGKKKADVYREAIEANKALEKRLQQGAAFDPEGSGYDMTSAVNAGFTPDNTGHWPSRIPDTGMLLKGRQHPTWPLTVAEEEILGNRVFKGLGNRYYSLPDYVNPY